MTHRIQWTEDAGRVRDQIDQQRKQYVLDAVDALAEDPYLPQSRPMNASGTLRKVILTEGVLAEYDVIDTLTIVVMLELFDDMQAIRSTRD